MLSIGPIATVEARIAALRQRMSFTGPGTVTTSSSASLAEQSANALEVTPDPWASGFDPFGAAYQQALTDKATAAAAAVSSGLGSGAQYAGSLGIESMLSGLSGSGVTAATGASVGRIGGFGDMPVPAELQQYGNGRLPDAMLQPIGQGGHRLYAPAAEAWKAAVQAAAADGVTLRVTDSYRTYDQQVDLVERKGLYSQGGYGAEPGTSNHGWGLAVDVDVTDPATLSWWRSNGYRFGFVEAVPREPWHWEFRPTQA
ncbi:MAG: M15 family metallopeptidase [Acidimicrobiales bacterium]